MKKILVTGGAGFIGSHLCERLLNEGNKVDCLDNLFTGTLENIKHLSNDPNFQFINWDVVTPFSGHYDQIYNLACPASPVHYQHDPVKTTKTSVLGALNMLELARQTNATILQASTSEVYGDPEVHPQPESYKGLVNPIGPRACYDEGKRCAESLFFDYYRQYGTKIKVVRIFNTYGPNMHPEDGRVVSNFIVQAIKNQQFTLYGDGSQTRSFCYVSDLVDGLVKMMNSPDHVLGPVNLGNPGEFTMLQLAEKVFYKVEYKERNNNPDNYIFAEPPSKVSFSRMLQYKALPADDPKQRKPDINLAKQLLNWEPTVSLDDGLDKTIDYFYNLIKGKNV